MNLNTTKIIEINNIIKYYGKNKVLDIDSFVFYKSNFYLLIGENGAGKSTLIKIITGLVKPTKGSILVLSKLISYVPERFSFPLNIKVYDFLDNLCRVRININRKDKIEALLNEWKIDKNKLIGELSKGMKQKLLIIQAIIEDVDLYIFDEPLNGLDPSSQAFFLNTLKRLKDLGKTVILCTHYDKYYNDIFDYALYFNGGIINEIIKLN
ncbi:MAG: ABC transporter ATP-binding protein [Bacilli bacterium]|nr:ABC transporter ATP-binding protein [Bacilli bacterium]